MEKSIMKIEIPGYDGQRIYNAVLKHQRKSIMQGKFICALFSDTEVCKFTKLDVIQLESLTFILRLGNWRPQLLFKFKKNQNSLIPRTHLRR